MCFLILAKMMSVKVAKNKNKWKTCPFLFSVTSLVDNLLVFLGDFFCDKQAERGQSQFQHVIITQRET